MLILTWAFKGEENELAEAFLPTGYAWHPHSGWELLSSFLSLLSDLFRAVWFIRKGVDYSVTQGNHSMTTVDSVGRATVAYNLLPTLLLGLLKVWFAALLLQQVTESRPSAWDMRSVSAEPGLRWLPNLALNTAKEQHAFEQISEQS